MKHLNELQESYSEGGLTIIGVTGEGKQPTEGFVSSTSMEYPYALDPKGGLSRFFGVGGIPHAVLVSPSGSILWRGHPSRLGKKTIEEALVGALQTPYWDWPKESKKLRKLLTNGDLGDALEEAQDLEAKGGADYYVAAVRGRIDGQLAQMDTAMSQGDYLSAQRLAEQTAKCLKGMPEADRADAILADIKADPEKGATLKVLEQIDRLLTKPAKNRRDAESKIKKLRKLRDKHPGSFAEKRAKAAIEKLRSKD